MNSTTIKLSRSKYIERDRNIAIIRLNSIEHVIGQPVMVRYYLDSSNEKIDVVTAIGVKNGIGEDCYKILSLGGLYIIRDVVTELPDVSALTHGELYLYKDENEIWNFVYEVGGTRKIEEITGGPFKFSCSENGYNYYFVDKVLKREDDFTTKSEIDNLGFVGLDDISDIFAKKTDLVTETENGLMRKEDKVKFDYITNGNLELVKPQITCTWDFFNASGNAITISPTPDVNNPVIEKGYKAKFSGTFKWTHEEGKKDPTQIEEESNWSSLPTTGVNSEVYESDFIDSNAVIKINIQAEKTGLMVDKNNSVVMATGMDTESDKRTITFLDRLYYGVSNSNSITASTIKGLSNNELVSSNSKIINNITCSDTEYFVYSYPSNLGDLSTIIQNEALPILESFTKTNVDITNAAGATISMNVYISNNPGAFTNVSLNFK